MRREPCNETNIYTACSHETWGALSHFTITYLTTIPKSISEISTVLPLEVYNRRECVRMPVAKPSCQCVFGHVWCCFTFQALHKLWGFWTWSCIVTHPTTAYPLLKMSSYDSLGTRLFALGSETTLSLIVGGAGVVYEKWAGLTGAMSMEGDRIVGTPGHSPGKRRRSYVRTS